MSGEIGGAVGKKEEEGGGVNNAFFHLQRN